jgi:hypothetical protein
MIIFYPSCTLFLFLVIFNISEEIDILNETLEENEVKFQKKN